LPEVSRVSMKACKGLQGDLQVQGDKSISHRAVLFGALAYGKTTIEGFLPGDDCLRTVWAIEAMGVKVDRLAETTFAIQGNGPEGLREPEAVLDLGNSGTGIRLLLGLVSGKNFFSVLTGDDSLRKRPMERVVEPLRQMGADIAGRQGGRFAPLAVQGQRLHGMDYPLPVPSAQVKSAILFAGLSAEGVTTVIEPQHTRDHTERLLKGFGGRCEIEGLTIRVWGEQRLEGRPVVVPGDLSSAAFFLVGGSIVPNSEILIRDVGINPTRTGILEALVEMGADITMDNRRELNGEPIANLRVKSASLKGFSLPKEWIPRIIDEIPVLCIAAACAEGETLIQGAGELRVKESDRITAMAEGLRRIGVDVEEFPDGLKIFGKGSIKGGWVESYGDHRVAMSFLIAGLVAEGEIVVGGTECIATSFPNFTPLLKGLMIH